MKYEKSEEFEMLCLLEAKDSGDGVKFADHNYVREHNFSGYIKQELLSTPDLTTSKRRFLNQMKERGLIEDIGSTDDQVCIRLSPLGYDTLAAHRNNTLGKRIIRRVEGWIDKAMTSIVLPILVAILTVIIMNQLGLSGATEQ